MVHIRPYDPAADLPALRACFIELQAWERQFEPALPEPEAAAQVYLAGMLESCAETSGCVFVADAAGNVIGFVCVLGKVVPTADESLEPYADVSDLVVLAAERRRGVGESLMAQAEAFAHGIGVRRIKVGVLVRNLGTHAFYRRCGFRDYSVQLVKRCRPANASTDPIGAVPSSALPLCRALLSIKRRQHLGAVSSMRGSRVPRRMEQRMNIVKRERPITLD